MKWLAEIDAIFQQAMNRKVPWRPLGFGILLAILSWTSTSHGTVEPAAGPEVVVEVVNALTQQPVTGLRVDAKRRIGAEFKWAARAYTDDAGAASFHLEGLGAGVVYVFFARPYNEAYAQSQDVDAPGTVRFLVGTLPVTVVAGGTGGALGETRVTLKEKQPGGSLHWVTRVTTNADGLVIFDPPGLGSGRTFVLEAPSPWDGTTKRSNEIAEIGGVTFVVGNAPLNATLLDALSLQPLPELRVTAYELTAEGKLAYRRHQMTDPAGAAIFDLDGLGEDRIYVLRADPFNGGSAYSENLLAAGEFVFKVGTLTVAVVEGGTHERMAATRVTAYERQDGGKLKYCRTGDTDENGIIRFDLPGLGQGRTYVLRALSPWDSSSKYSNDVTQTGAMVFTVGNAPLRVSLVNSLTGVALPNERIDAYARTEENGLQWRARQYTDAQGRAVFDLDGLGEGRVYVLQARPYSTGYVYSDELTAPGDLEFKVGKLEVTVVDGAEREPLQNVQVTARERLEGGSLAYRGKGLTDEHGIIRFDLPGLGKGATYVLEAYSPYDNTTKRSDDLEKNGRYTFVVGNAPLRVLLVNGLSGDPVPNTRIDAYERVGLDHEIWVARRTTDENGVAVFDLDGLGDGRVYVLATTPYNGGKVYSRDITAPGAFEFRVGTLEVLVLSGATDQPMTDTRVDVRELLPDGKTEWRQRGTTDAEGMVRFDLAGLQQVSAPHAVAAAETTAVEVSSVGFVWNGGDEPAAEEPDPDRPRTYLLEVRSPVDGSVKRSDPITSEGRITFVAGNEPLVVTLINGLSGTPLPDMQVTARELLANGEAKWVNRRTTDAGGMVAFDLDGLGDGRTYVLEVRPYNGGYVRSDSITEPGEVYFRVGTIPVTLIDGDQNLPLFERKIIAYEKLPNGELHWFNQGYTDATGTVHFDLPGVSRTISRQQPPAAMPSERVFVFRAYRPFGEHSNYYSRFVREEGPVDMRITRDGEHPIDLTPPTVSISTPVDGANVNGDGFNVSGTAADNNTVSVLFVTVSDPVAGQNNILPSYDAATGQWTVQVAQAMVTVGQVVTITATVLDQAQNQATASISVNVITDMAAPQIGFTSHQNGDSVEKTGFLLSGLATDDIGVTDLTATLDDPVLGRTLDQKPVAVAADGSWTLAVLNGQVTQDQQITITMTARDGVGNGAAASIDLLVVAVDFEAHQLINRITFGITPDLLNEVATSGTDAFLNQQLDPGGIDDSAFQALLAGFQPASTGELQRYALLHAVFSRRQLLEVMTQFWDNHFNTDVNKHDNVGYELAENDLFRQNALGNFRDLLQISATSPAMQIYLDNYLNVKAEPNENYPRELLELHAMGVDGGYTQADVEEVAKAFTGWTVQNGQLFFDANEHDTTEKVFLGTVMPAGRGMEDGEQVLDILAAHPSTARFICTKLTKLFVSDAAPATVVARCAAIFLASGGGIRDVVEAILRSPEFADPAYFRAKIKTPLEMVAGFARNLRASTNASDLHAWMRDMGMRLFENPVPTGWSESGDDWVNSNLLLQRVKFVNHVARNNNGTTLSLRQFFLDNGHSTADGIAGFLFQLLFDFDFTALEYQVAIDVLTQGGVQAFDINAPDAETRLRRMVATVSSYPGYQYQ